ncbi:MFS transporter [Streptomyces sp. NPDC048191]|uniref:MFS transporter n=1 Tax=Streptomyces sp. NPDC048191 TaxID=3155484 RepID=UPI0033C039AC
MGTTGKPDRRRAQDTYREVIGLTGPLLPCVSFLGRLPTATVQFGSVLLVARTSGSLSAAGLTGGALALGQVACGPLVGRLADRHGQRRVVPALSLANALALALLVAGALAGLPAPVLALLGAAAGATVPLIGPLARTRLVALARRAGAPEATVGAALSFESTLDELSFVLGPALVGVASVLAHPAYAMGGAAALVATCGSAFALHPTARPTTPKPSPSAPRPREDLASAPAHRGEARAAVPHPEDRAVARDPDDPAAEPTGQVSAAGLIRAPGCEVPGVGPVSAAECAAPRGGGVNAADLVAPTRGAGGRARGGAVRPGLPRCVAGLLGALALQGAMFGACQAGITALTGRLGQEDQAGLVYAAMGVMSAVAGFGTAAVPERFGPRARWRLATGACCALSLPLLGVTGLPGLYAVVTVLGVTYAPHLITVFGLLERAVAPSRLAEAMGTATSALVGGQALAVAVTGRLADSHGPSAAFAAASTAAALAFALALTTRPTTYRPLPRTPLTPAAGAPSGCGRAG